MSVYPFSDIKPRDLFSRKGTSSRTGVMVQFPLVRVVVAIFFLLPVFALNWVLVLGVIDKVSEPAATVIDFIRMAVTIPLVFYCYLLYCRRIENREAVETGLRGSKRQWVSGALLASGLVSLLVGVIAIFASFEIIEYRSILLLAKNALMFSMGALMQDVIFLCILFRLSEELLGTWIAVILSLMVFALVHGFNPNQNAHSVFFLALSSLALFAPFILTRQIWFSWGYHASWNFMQAGVFGMANSGVMFPGWMVSRVDGPEWLTGGAVGLEGSFLALSADLAIGIALMVLAVKWGRTVRPSWKRSG